MERTFRIYAHATVNSLTMKIYVAHSRSFDFEKELYEPIRQSDLSKKHTFFFPHGGGEEVKTKDVIQNSDLLIAEVSSPATGVGIELGWADAFDIPIAAFYKEGSKIPGSVHHVTEQMLSYKNTGDLLVVLEQELKRRDI